MSYFENVKLGGLALMRGEDANWELARLTYENTIDGGGPPGAGRVQMDVWCRDVREVSGRKFSRWTGVIYRAIWERFGTLEVPPTLPSWSEAYEAVKPGNRDRFTDWGADNVLKKGSAEIKVETFRRLAEDPDVAASQEAQKAALPLGIQFYRQREQNVREHWRADEASERQEERLERIGTALDVQAVCEQYLRAVRVFEEQLSSLLEQDRPAQAPFLHVRLAVQRIRDGCDRLEQWLEHERSDVDAFVASVLHPESRP